MARRVRNRKRMNGMENGMVIESHPTKGGGEIVKIRPLNEKRAKKRTSHKRR